MTPERPHDPEPQSLGVHSLPVTHTDEGTRPPAIVLVHGLPGSVRDFRWLGAALRELAPEARVVRLDMPGFGGTDVRLGGAMTIEERAALAGSSSAAP